MWSLFHSRETDLVFLTFWNHLHLFVCPPLAPLPAQPTCGGQRSTSPSTSWVLGTELKMSGWQQALYPSSQWAGPFQIERFFFFFSFWKDRNWHFSLKIYAERFRSDMSSRLQLTFKCSIKNYIHVWREKWGKCDQNGNSWWLWWSWSEWLNSLFPELGRSQVFRVKC